ncbi:MAG: FAD-dependent oxidoreductase [Candidatus Korarchaeota archaeon]|nr:FAD-dependent oxidoreductase [Candidatus Korarchaeota archaeon]
MRAVVIGGGPAGMAAASRIRKHRPESEIIVIEKTKYVSFALCGIPYYVGGVIKSLDDLMYYPPSFFVEKRRIDLELEAVAERILPSEKKVVYRKGGEVRELEYDVLIVATGARSKLPPIPGLDNEGVLSAHHLDEGEEIRRRVLKSRRVAIIGAGLNGMEFAENIARLGKEVHVFEYFGWPLPKGLDEDMGEVMKELLSSAEVKFHFGTPVREVGRTGEALKVEAGDSSMNVDLVLVFAGVEPNVDLLKEAGAEVGETGAIKVDSKMRTNLRDVYAAGDNVEAVNRVTGRPDWMPFAQIANKMGLVAGSNAAGKETDFPGAVRTWTAEVFGIEVAGTGFTEREAKEKGFDVKGVMIKGRNKAHYMPGSDYLWVKLVVSEDGTVMGVQAIGKGALARVNVAATLLPYKPKSRDLIFTDVGYAPPLAPVWDPIVVAGRKIDPVL